MPGGGRRTCGGGRRGRGSAAWRRAGAGGAACARPPRWPRSAGSRRGRRRRRRAARAAGGRSPRAARCGLAQVEAGVTSQTSSRGSSAPSSSWPSALPHRGCEPGAATRARRADGAGPGPSPSSWRRVHAAARSRSYAALIWAIRISASRPPPRSGCHCLARRAERRRRLVRRRPRGSPEHLVRVHPRIVPGPGACAAERPGVIIRGARRPPRSCRARGRVTARRRAPPFF